jgi:hypothetical protein
MRRRTGNQRFKSGHKVCEAEYRKWPGKYDLRARNVPEPIISRGGLRSADETGLKSAHKDDRPTAHGLREWWWDGDPAAGDHSLYDQDGLTIARIVLAGHRYHLRAPIAIPVQSWPDLDAAKRGAEHIALMALPLDPKAAARVKRDNAAPNPLGAPLNRSSYQGAASDWTPAGAGADVPDIPAALRRVR